MDKNEVKEITPDKLREYMDNHEESEFLLVDVRQPEEYEAGHIPGARFQPLPELEAKIFELPDDRNLVFYCRTGGRSIAAASLASEAEVTEKNIFNLSGGIMSWEGKTLQDYPVIDLFKEAADYQTGLLRAMDLEKGAWLFYGRLIEEYGDIDILPTLKELFNAEKAHARQVYGFWKAGEKEPIEFDKLFTDLKGEIIEGGEDIGRAVSRIKKMEGNISLTIIEVSLQIEYKAFELYKVSAEMSEKKEAREAFLSIAQAEKGHMKALSKALKGIL